MRQTLGIKKQYTKKLFNFIEITKLTINPVYWNNTKGRRYDIMICDKQFMNNQTEKELINIVFRPMAKKFILWRI
jgi:hypothetical protein